MGQVIMGIKPDQVWGADVVPEYSPGDVGGTDSTDVGYKEFIFVKAAEAITAAGYVCVFIDPDSAEMADTTSTAPGTKGPGARAGVAMAAIASTGHGWLQIYGKGSVRTLASAAVGTQLNTTGTPGALDDDATAGSEVISGVSLGTASGGAAETNADAFFSYPTVLRTL